MMEKLIAGLLVVLVVVCIALGIYWAIWELWCWILPIFWVAGPTAIIRPDFWPFAGMWSLVSLVGKAIFGGKK